MGATTRRNRRETVSVVRRGPRRSRLSGAVRGALLGGGGMALWAALVPPAPAQTLALSALDPRDGFRVNGEALEDQSGRSVSGAGDINGDGIDDLLIGAWLADPNGIFHAGASYVVFGRDLAGSINSSAEIDLSDLDGANGFQINGELAEDSAGTSVSGAGDVNGDGIDDLLVGAMGADPNGDLSGASYVVFGRDTAATSANFPANLELSDLDGTNGFQINGEAMLDRSGRSVSGAGDINGDGIDDLLVGAYAADPNAISASGTSYVVFGRDTAASDNFPANVELLDLHSGTGFRINGEADGDFAGFSVSQAGDINGDGIDDLLVGADHADPHGNLSGASYVVFGRNTAANGNFPVDFNLSSLNGTNGFRINGEAAGDQLGVSVTGAGDINGDGIDDLLVGATLADPNGYDRAGASYVVFGRDTTAGSPFPGLFELSDLDGTNGFQINGEAEHDRSGRGVSAAGDVNGDGVDDVLVGARFAASSGAGYVVFGRDTMTGGNFPAALELSDLDGMNGFQVNGEASLDNAGYSLSEAGDVNGDGNDDLLIGAYRADPNGTGSAGASYVVFGGDVDGDGLVNALDDDDDGDGVLDDDDAFPHDPTETQDSDGDGVGDNADSDPFDPDNTGLVVALPIGSFDAAAYGNGFGSNEHLSALGAVFQWNGKGGRLIHARGIDLDTRKELAYSVNGTRLGHLGKGPNDGNARDSLIWLEPRHLAMGTNRITFENNASDTWGVDRLGMFKEGEGFGNIKKNPKLKDTFHKKGMELHVHGKRAKIIKLAAWDNARTKGGEAEVEIKRNGKILGSVPKSKKNKVGPTWYLYLPKKQAKTDNLLLIDNRIKDNTEWGIVLEKLFKGTARAGRIQGGLKGTKQKVDYLAPLDKNKNRKLLIRYHDVDSATELEIHVDGKFVGNAPKTRNNQWVKDTVRLPGTRKPRLAKISVETTRNKDRWGAAIRGWE